MYDIKNFEPFNGESLDSSHIVLVWSKKDGYYFDRFDSAVINSNVKIVAEEI